MKRIHLVRHGAVLNPDAVVYGRLPGFPLSPEGQAQVQMTAAFLKRTLASSLNHIIASPLQRAQQTASIVAKGYGANVVTDEQLIEAGSPFDGLPRRFAPMQYVSRYFDRTRAHQHEAPGDVAARMMRAVREALLLEGLDVVLVAHQFPIQMARVGFERQLDERSSFFFKRVPMALLRVRCSLASVTTLSFQTGALTPTIHYWEP